VPDKNLRGQLDPELKLVKNHPGSIISMKFLDEPCFRSYRDISFVHEQPYYVGSERRIWFNFKFKTDLRMSPVNPCFSCAMRNDLCSKLSMVETRIRVEFMILSMVGNCCSRKRNVGLLKQVAMIESFAAEHMHVNDVVAHLRDAGYKDSQISDALVYTQIVGRVHIIDEVCVIVARSGRVINSGTYMPRAEKKDRAMAYKVGYKPHLPVPSLIAQSGIRRFKYLLQCMKHMNVYVSTAVKYACPNTFVYSEDKQSCLIAGGVEDIDIAQESVNYVALLPEYGQVESAYGWKVEQMYWVTILIRQSYIDTLTSQEDALCAMIRNW